MNSNEVAKGLKEDRSSSSFFDDDCDEGDDQSVCVRLMHVETTKRQPKNQDELRICKSNNQDGY